ncbi:hypothetical protein BH11PSE8_BH11PSE8_04310 [soil metagenome]
MACFENDSTSNPSIWMQRFSIRLMQLHPGLRAAAAMKHATDAWSEAQRREPEEAARAYACRGARGA